jgi:acyl-lipid omega-6 desaturase (Delta-12 desaturase)
MTRRWRNARREERAMQPSRPAGDPSAATRLPTNRRGFAWILGESACTAGAIGLAGLSFARMQANASWLIVWLLSEFALGLLIFQWFVLMHGCGHRALFASRRLNDFFGYVASTICLVPYPSWRYVHAQHHRWVGWMDKDPTTRSLARPPPPAWLGRVVDFCWRYWIPVFSLIFGVTMFWNAGNVAAVAPAASQRRRTWFGILLIAVLYAALIALGGARFFGVWALAFVSYLSIADPILLSQHVHIPLLRADGATVAPFAPAAQDVFSRTIVVRSWAARWVFLEFTSHGVHHAYPRLAHYDIGRVPFAPSHAIRLFAWLRLAKGVPAARLLYESTRETGICL